MRHHVAGYVASVELHDFSDLDLREEGEREREKEEGSCFFYALDKRAIWDFSILSPLHRIVDLNFNSK